MPDTIGWTTNPTNGHSYGVISSDNWLECNAIALSEGVHLVSINDATEQNWLVTQFGGDSLYWIGLTDQQYEGEFVWTTGEPVTYTNWAASEPNNFDEEDYAVINWDLGGAWNDSGLGYSIAAIVERNGDVAPVISISTTAANSIRSEGNAGTNAYTFTVNRTSAVGAATVGYTVVGAADTLAGNHTAAVATDFVGGVLPTGTISFAAGQLSQTITVNVAGDTTVEGNERFNVNLTTATGGTLSPTARSSYGYINNDDVAPSVISISTTAANSIRNEGNAGTNAYTFTVNRTSAVGAATVGYTVVGATDTLAGNHTAASATDFVGGVLPTGTISFAAGQLSQTITINVAGDTTVEGNERFNVNLTTATGGTLSPTASSSFGYINNDDVAPSVISISTTAPTSIRSEGNAGTNAYTFTVNRTSAAGAATVGYTVVGATDTLAGNHTAAVATDFVGGVLPTGTISFAAGQLSRTITVNVYGDTTVEGNERFNVNLTTATGGTLSSTARSSFGYINNDDLGADNAGNTTTAARNIGALSATARTFTDWVGTADTNDFYQFTLNSLSTLRLNLIGLSANANVIVYAANGTGIMGSGSNVGNASEAVTINNLTAGTYYARVYPGAATDNTNYSLALTAQSQTAMVDLAGNSRATARNIGVLAATTQIFNDSITPGSDTDDYYRFTISGTSDVRLSVAGLDSNLYYLPLNIYAEGNNTTLFNQWLSNNDSVTLHGYAPGTYYIQCGAYYANVPSSYNISMSASAVLPNNAGNSFATASNVGILNPTQHYYNGRISATDTNDYYRFTLDGIRSLSVQLSGLVADADVVVYAADMVTMMHSEYTIQTGTSGEYIYIDNLAAGTYYARVYPHTTTTTNTPYMLSMQGWLPGMGCNNTSELVVGGNGNDSLAASNTNDTILVGGSGNDTLLGNNYFDVLVGDAGNDTLTGGAGSDRFRFLTAVGNDIDTITDFQPGTDRIEVFSPNFANILQGNLAANRFVAAGTTLTTGTAVFLYNGTTGSLAFDSDGNGTAAAVQIATLTGHPTLRASDFQVVAA